MSEPRQPSESERRRALERELAGLKGLRDHPGLPYLYAVYDKERQGYIREAIKPSNSEEKCREARIRQDQLGLAPKRLEKRISDIEKELAK